MKQRTRTMFVALSFSAIALGWVLAGSLAARAPDTKTKPAKPADEVFGLSKVWQMHLDVPAKEWERMQPTGMGGPGFGPGRPGGPGATRETKPDSHRGSGFGTEFPFGRGSVTVGA